MADDLLKIALKELGADVPTTQSVLRIAVVLAEAANRLPRLAGREKLDLVLQTLRGVLATPAVRDRIPEEARAPLTLVIDTVVPETLALVIEAGRGRFDLKKPSVGCLAKLGALLCRSAAAVVTDPEAKRALVAAADATSVVAVAVAVAVDVSEAPAPAPAPPVVAVEMIEIAPAAAPSSAELEKEKTVEPAKSAPSALPAGDLEIRPPEPTPEPVVNP